jgi:hypothetical protein
MGNPYWNSESVKEGGNLIKQKNHHVINAS